MSAVLLEALRWLGATGSAALVGWLVSRRKIEGEAKQAEGAGSKSHAEGQVALSAQWQAERDSILRQASEARIGAETARRECEDQNRRIKADFEAFADVIEELVPLLPPGDSQRKARVALRAARLAI